MTLSEIEGELRDATSPVQPLLPLFSPALQPTFRYCPCTVFGPCSMASRRSALPCRWRGHLSKSVGGTLTCCKVALTVGRQTVLYGELFAVCAAQKRPWSCTIPPPGLPSPRCSFLLHSRRPCLALTGVNHLCPMLHVSYLLSCCSSSRFFNVAHVFASISCTYDAIIILISTF